jgi:hypothetical protein
VKAHPKNEDAAEAMQQISLIYRSQGKIVEADAWRDKLLREHPKSPAAKAVQPTSNAAIEWHFFNASTNTLTPSNTVNYTIKPDGRVYLAEPFSTLYQPHLTQPHLTQPQLPQLFQNQGVWYTLPKKEEKKDEKSNKEK